MVISVKYISTIFSHSFNSTTRGLSSTCGAHLPTHVHWQFVYLNIEAYLKSYSLFLRPFCTPSNAHAHPSNVFTSICVRCSLLTHLTRLLVRLMGGHGSHGLSAEGMKDVIKSPKRNPIRSPGPAGPKTYSIIYFFLTQSTVHSTAQLEIIFLMTHTLSITMELHTNIHPAIQI